MQENLNIYVVFHAMEKRNRKKSGAEKVLNKNPEKGCLSWAWLVWRPAQVGKMPKQCQNAKVVNVLSPCQPLFSVVWFVGGGRGRQEGGGWVRREATEKRTPSSAWEARCASETYSSTREREKARC